MCFRLNEQANNRSWVVSLPSCIKIPKCMPKRFIIFISYLTLYVDELHQCIISYKCVESLRYVLSNYNWSSSWKIGLWVNFHIIYHDLNVTWFSGLQISSRGVDLHIYNSILLYTLGFHFLSKKRNINTHASICISPELHKVETPFEVFIVLF